MKYIKRKSAVKPIIGSIVDTTNINDKTLNTYSANVIDGLLGGTSWKIATVNTEYFSDGIVRYTQIGKLVIVQILDLVISAPISGNEMPLITGLPQAKDFTAFLIQGTDGNNVTNFRMVLAQDDTIIRSWYYTKDANSYMRYYGQFIYFTE